MINLGYLMEKTVTASPTSVGQAQGERRREFQRPPQKYFGYASANSWDLSIGGQNHNLSYGVIHGGRSYADFTDLNLKKRACACSP